MTSIAYAEYEPLFQMTKGTPYLSIVSVKLSCDYRICRRALQKLVMVTKTLLNADDWYNKYW